MYERYVATPDDASIMQGLIGRDTGCDNNSDSICYTNIDNIERYEAMWNSGFEDSSIEWNSKTTLYRKGSLSAKNTFNNRDEYAGFSGSDDDDESVHSTPDVPVEPIIKRFRTQEEGKRYYDRVLKPLYNGRGPNLKKANAQGFYEATIRTVKKVFYRNELFSERRCNIENGAGYAFRPCYRDVSDPNTVEWWFIHYPLE